MNPKDYPYTYRREDGDNSIVDARDDHVVWRGLERHVALSVGAVLNDEHNRLHKNPPSPALPRYAVRFVDSQTSWLMRRSRGTNRVVYEDLSSFRRLDEAQRVCDIMNQSEPS